MSEYIEGESEDIWMHRALLRYCQEDQILLSGKIEQSTERLRGTNNPVTKLVAIVSRGVYSRRLEQANALVDHFAILTDGTDLRA